ncbi:haloacid dehalogenase-like hydrolase-like protein [Strigomonas culicis]|uniref:Haloacid dehalogenase-like hydrolase-like protein n=2 Tax=Strigomonas culicis TaxID=28005 RepID=S9ULM2_9TRYP|nr:haloacid dehalogenase-like hydrolase-like protein [Strigomonas culicis]|eukprot:EPY31747.1 haloacid dehalogenase-like hydrolase-like protein [Strigomonas culicis]
MVTSNGAVGRDALTNELVYQRTIDPAIAYELYNEVVPKNETRINCNCNQNDVWFCRHNWEEVLAFHQESRLTFQVVPDTPKLVAAPAGGAGGTIRDGDFSGVVKFFYTCWDRPLLERLEAYLQERYKDELTVNISASYCVDIQAKGVDKTHGLRSIFAHMARKELGNEGDKEEAVRQKVEACMRQSIAFGDDLNDKSMLVNVGRGFVMANANPKLKQETAQAPFQNQLEVIGNNADDSVCRKIRELFDLSERA